MFIVQPASSFGDVICRELTSADGSSAKWQVLEFAVAWLNRSGAQRIGKAIRRFLDRGGQVLATVGLDFGHTTYEGLLSLLELEAEGLAISTRVYFDENAACTFHPKVFLFSNLEEAHLYVGSNNLTGAGISTNVEAALGHFAPIADSTIQAVRRELAAWREDHEHCRQLTSGLLKLLRERGYTLTEQECRLRRTLDIATRGTRQESGEPPLFGRSKVRTGRAAGLSNTSTKDGKIHAPEKAGVLLMRVRPRRNGGQLQISMKVLETPFMKGVSRIFSVDGTPRHIGYNKARGVLNTARFEAPEMRGMEKPVAQFKWVTIGNTKELQYMLLDAAKDEEGARIWKRLEEGISTPLATNLEGLSRDSTVLSTSNRAQAQWYRLDSA